MEPRPLNPSTVAIAPSLRGRSERVDRVTNLMQRNALPLLAFVLPGPLCDRHGHASEHAENRESDEQLDQCKASRRASVSSAVRSANERSSPGLIASTC